MTDKDFQALLDVSGSVILRLGSDIVLAVTIFNFYKNYNSRKIEEAKQKSVGAEALNKMEVRVDTLEQLLQKYFRDFFHINK